MAEIIRLEWIRDRKGYEIRSLKVRALGSKFKQKEYICSVSGADNFVPKGEKFVLEGIHRGVAFDLANASSTPKGALEFTNKWGLLRGRDELDHSKPIKKRRTYSESLSDFYSQQNLVRELLKDFKSENFKKWEQRLSGRSRDLDLLLKIPIRAWQPGMGSFAINVRVPPGSKTPHIFLTPQTLFDFILIEICQAGANGVKLRQCPVCGEYFSVGPGTGRNFKRVYNRDACKKAASRARRK